MSIASGFVPNMAKNAVVKTVSAVKAEVRGIISEELKELNDMIRPAVKLAAYGIAIAVVIVAAVAVYRYITKPANGV